MVVEKDQIDELNSSLNYLLNELSGLEDDFMEVEKIFFKLHPSLVALVDRADELTKTMSNQGLNLAARRTKRLKMTLEHFQRHHGYHLDHFHMVFSAIKTAISKAPNEILPSPWQEQLFKQFDEAADWVKKLAKHRTDYIKFVLVQSSGMNFMIPSEKILWKKQVPNKDKLKIQIKHLAEPNIFRFNRLLVRELDEKKPLEMTGLLLLAPNGDRQGIMVDQMEGEIMISRKLLKRKTEYMHHGNNRFEPFLQMRGKRYFLRQVHTDTNSLG